MMKSLISWFHTMTFCLYEANPVKYSRGRRVFVWRSVGGGGGGEGELSALLFP